MIRTEKIVFLLCSVPLGGTASSVDISTTYWVGEEGTTGDPDEGVHGYGIRSVKGGSNSTTQAGSRFLTPVEGPKAPKAESGLGF